MIEGLAEQIWSVTDFVAVFNQTINYAYPAVHVEGEVSSLRVSKNKWVYFDLKDENSSLKFFGSVYSLPGPLQDGMTVIVRGAPRLHNLYGFSVNFDSIKPVGEGSIKKAKSLLEQKLAKEGLFEQSRKRQLPYPPMKVGLVTSIGSAAYHDFVKIINQRWCGLTVIAKDVQVQGDNASSQIIEAIQSLNSVNDIEVIVIIRGGGSSDDLAAFSDERVVRAVALSRIPTLVAIGHEIDVSLSELAADVRASTPSNAAELLTPDKKSELKVIKRDRDEISSALETVLADAKNDLIRDSDSIINILNRLLDLARSETLISSNFLETLNPSAIFDRGYAVLRTKDNKIIKSTRDVNLGDKIIANVKDGVIHSKVTEV